MRKKTIKTREPGLIAIADEIISHITCGLILVPDIPAEAFMESYMMRDGDKMAALGMPVDLSAG